MSKQSAWRLVVGVLSIWILTVVGYLVREVFRLFESGSGMIAVGSTLIALAIFHLGPPLVVIAGLFIGRRARGARHAA